MRPPPQTQEECLLWAKYGCKRGNNCSLTLYIYMSTIYQKSEGKWSGMSGKACSSSRMIGICSVVICSVSGCLCNLFRIRIRTMKSVPYPCHPYVIRSVSVCLCNLFRIRIRTMKSVPYPYVICSVSVCLCNLFRIRIRM
jgi:hypothetical protein